MEKENDSVVYMLSKKFALRIISLYAYLKDEKHEYILSKQLLRSGTSIGANLAESKFAQSEADFINKIKVSLKEANESSYWLELLFESNYLTKDEFEPIDNDLKTIIGTMVNIVNKLRIKDQ